MAAPCFGTADGHLPIAGRCRQRLLRRASRAAKRRWHNVLAHRSRSGPAEPNTEQKHDLSLIALLAPPF